MGSVGTVNMARDYIVVTSNVHWAGSNVLMASDNHSRTLFTPVSFERASSFYAGQLHWMWLRRASYLAVARTPISVVRCTSSTVTQSTRIRGHIEIDTTADT